MENTVLIQSLIAVLISSVIAIRAYKRNSLDVSGALAGFLVMAIHFTAGYRGIAAILVVMIWKLTGWEDKCLGSKNETPLVTALIGGVIGHYCCCNGDTWSSEIGVLSDDQPRLITTFKLLVIPVSTLAGLVGSLIDSLLGATLQFSGFCSVSKPGPTVKKFSGLRILDNNAVNLVSIFLTSILTSVACTYIF